ncbi:MAG: rhodanese-like domain-containing protein [Saprospiraceae bacterium]
MEAKTTTQDYLFLPNRQEKDTKFIILDVRTCQEFVGGHVKGAIHIPYDEIHLNIQKIKSWGKPIITYSKDGKRSQAASSQLSLFGVKAIDGGNMQKVKALFGQMD